MPTSGHTPQQQTAMQSKYTALVASLVAVKAAGVTTAAAAHAADMADLQLAAAREAEPKLT